MQSDGPSTCADEASPLYADVLVPRHISKSFTYLVPAALRSTIGIGQRVLVPFGRAMLEAAVVSLSQERPAGVNPAHLKEIRSLVDGANEGKKPSILFELSRRVSEHYIAPWGQCLRLIYPAGHKRKQPALRYVATEQGRAALKEGRCPEPLRPLLTRIARRATGILSSTLLSSPSRQFGRSMKTLQAQGWITSVASTPGKRDHPASEVVTPAPHALDREHIPSDTVWAVCVVESIRRKQGGKIILQAPWRDRVGVLAAAIIEVQFLKKSAIVLCGEAARAEWLGHLLAALTKVPMRFLHREGEMSDEDFPGIAIGTRSAVFAPLSSVGLIWVEGEDDPALKEMQEPRYHARDVACMRAELEGALVVLASAHPSLESKSDVAARHCTFREPLAHRPAIALVNLREEAAGLLLSQALIGAMRESIESKTGVVLFLNRKGYAGALVCRDCGWVPRCAACGVALTYYRGIAKLACRYCGQTAALPESCPTCGAARLNPVGEGTERVELEVRRLFPLAKIARLDGDSLRRPAEARRLWNQVYNGDCDVMIGTQALFQREPLPLMGLVGIVQADSGLHVPDFRAAERTYQLLTDAAAVARPASDGGQVLIQTVLPDHHAIEAVVSGEPSRFYDEELAARRLLGYPPARPLVSLSVSGRQPRLVETAAQQWRQSLEKFVSGDAAMILGPVPALGGRSQGQYRFQMLVKGSDRAGLCRSIRESVERMEREHKKGQIKFVVDVDPVDMG